MADLSAIVVVGASLAGFRAAQELRTQGFAGSITVVGGELHHPYDRPPLSKAVLAGDKDGDSTELRATGAVEDLALEWRLGEWATRLDLEGRRVSLASGDTLDFDGLVIATGAAPRRLPFGNDLAGVHTLRTLDDCLAIRADLDAAPSRVVVVGAGFIGAEVAATCRRRGLEVTVVEPLTVPLERALGPEVGAVCAAMHRDEGVDLRLGVGVSDIVGDGRVGRVVLDDGRDVAADVVVVGVGVRPVTDWLEGSGLTLGDGVVCDATCLAAPRVVAAGDVARWPNQRYGEMMRIEHWDNAVSMGVAAANRLLVEDGDAEPFAPVPWFWSDQYDAKIQLSGRGGPGHDTHVVGSMEDRKFAVLYGRDGQLTGCLGWSMPRVVVQQQLAIEAGTSWEDAVAAVS